MRGITLTVTPDQEVWLKHFAEHQCEGAADNLGTRTPLHLVQTRRQEVVFDGGDIGESVGYFDVNMDCEIFEDVDSLFKAHGIDQYLPYEEAQYSIINDVCVDDYKSYFAAYGIKDIQIVSICPFWETVSYHFTLKAAKEYMEYQRHNLTNPRTFTVSPGYSNKGDYEHFFSFLQEAGKKLLQEDLCRLKPEDPEDYVDPAWYL